MPVAGQKALSAQTPKTTQPIAMVTGPVTGLVDGNGKPVTGNMNWPAFVTQAWRYMFQASTTAVTGAVNTASRGSFTLNPSATSTTVTDVNVTPTSDVYIRPKTSDAANDMATTWITPGTGQFTVNHANNSRNDRTFSYVVVN